MTSNRTQARQQERQSVPVLITWDVDPDLYIPLEQRQWALKTALDACWSVGIHATFFFTAQTAHVYLGQIEQLLRQGHEIGCHGLTHGDEEDYNRMSLDMQRSFIQKATVRLQALTGQSVRAFRSPRVKTSANTLMLLSESGYCADSSVCSQRLDFLSSNLLNVGWVFAPRRTYRPHRNSPFRSGDIPIWEIPISAIGLPFISSTLRVFGLAATKMLFRLLYAESRWTGKPIVYLAHPVEFRARKADGTPRTRAAKNLKLKYFSPTYIRTHGFRFRNIFYKLSGKALLGSTRSLFAYMASFPHTTFMTVSEYVDQYTEELECQDA